MELQENEANMAFMDEYAQKFYKMAKEDEKTFRKAMEKGYTLKDIQTLCARAGVPLSLACMHKVLLHEPNDAPCEGVSAPADADAQA